MEMLKTPEDIAKRLEDSKIEPDDHQLLYVLWNVAYQLARVVQRMDWELGFRRRRS